MQASIPGEVGWRLDLYRQIFGFCQQGSFSLARFLALVPDRLRLAYGESVERIRIPVAIGPDVMAAWVGTLPAGATPNEGPLFSSPAALRRLLRLAQMDPGIDVVRLGRWMNGSGEALINAIAQQYLKGFSEIGQGEGGEETAYLVHLQLLESFRRANAQAQFAGPVPDALLVMTLIDIALRATVESDRVGDLSARLALQFAATLSPFAFEADPDALVARPLNNYRTIAPALALARRVIQEPFEVIDLERVADTIATRLAKDPALRSSLIHDMFVDLVRDCLLLIVAQETSDRADAEVEYLHQISRAGVHVPQAVLNESRRAQLAEVLSRPRFAESRPAAALRNLLDSAPAIIAGDIAPLGKSGDVDARAKVAARGAIVMVLDGHTEALKRDLHRIVSYVDVEAQPRAFEEGRCYLLSRGSQPLYRLPKRQREAHLFIDTSDLTARLFDVDARSAADTLKRFFYDPVLELVERRAGPDGAAIRLARLTEDSMGFCGDIVALLELAVRILRTVQQTNDALDEQDSEILGGQSSALEELDEELGRIDKRVEVIDEMLRRLKEGEPSVRFLRDERTLLAERFGALKKSQARIKSRVRGREVRCGAFMTFGEVAEHVNLGMKGASVTLSSAMLEASLGVGRSARIERERERVLRYAERMKSDAAMQIPYRVMVREFAMAESKDDPITEIHNIGCAMSQQALDQFMKTRRGVLQFDEFEVSTVDFDQTFRRRFVIEGAVERFVLARRTHDDSPIVLFHHAGALRMGAREAPRSVDVWEAILADSPFAHALFEMMDQRHG